MEAEIRFWDYYYVQCFGDVLMSSALTFTRDKNKALHSPLQFADKTQNCSEIAGSHWWSRTESRSKIFKQKAEQKHVWVHIWLQPHKEITSDNLYYVKHWGLLNLYMYEFYWFCCLVFFTWYLRQLNYWKDKVQVHILSPQQPWQWDSAVSKTWNKNRKKKKKILSSGFQSMLPEDNYQSHDEFIIIMRARAGFLFCILNSCIEASHCKWANSKCELDRLCVHNTHCLLGSAGGRWGNHLDEQSQVCLHTNHQPPLSWFWIYKNSLLGLKLKVWYSCWHPTPCWRMINWSRLSNCLTATQPQAPVLKFCLNYT